VDGCVALLKTSCADTAWPHWKLRSGSNIVRPPATVDVHEMQAKPHHPEVGEACGQYAMLHENRNRSLQFTPIINHELVFPCWYHEVMKNVLPKHH
jgi:hypothetical protein